MKRVYFEIFGKKIAVNINEYKRNLYSDAQIEYYIRGAIKIQKIERVESGEEIPDVIKDLFGAFDKKN